VPAELRHYPIIVNHACIFCRNLPLSGIYLYAILAKELFTTVLAVGFEPYLGFYHQPKYGRPALALDMMEEFRPVIADAAAFSLFNKKELTDKDFIKTGIMISMTAEAKKRF
jgi:CRISPR-associated protein Cas1